jgi:hypothetical protein
VVDDLASVGDSVFIVDDLFWNHPARSLELAEALKKRGVHKRWILVQSRTDLVARHPELLEAWRPIARDFDIFFGLEAASDRALAEVVKDAGVNSSIEAAQIARDGSTESPATFWSIPTGRRQLRSSGISFRQQLPARRIHHSDAASGNRPLRQALADSQRQPWFKYDMHHVLWEPRLGAKRFFELYAETWRRSILNTAGEKSWLDWMKQVRPGQMAYLTRVLIRDTTNDEGGGVPEGAHRVVVGSARRYRGRATGVLAARLRSEGQRRLIAHAFLCPRRVRRAAIVACA